MEPPAKKPRVIQGVQAVGLRTPAKAVEAFAQCLRDLPDDEGESWTHVSRQVVQFVTGWNTVYGTVVKELELPTDAGGTLKVPIVCPFALLSHLSRTSSTFGAFLHEHLQGAEAKVALCGDDTTPGNQLRPDSVNKITPVYFTILN